MNLITSMKEALGTAYCLYTKTHAFHWNVEGVNFKQFHDLFGEQYLDIFNSIDVLAEHIRQLDAYAPSSPERMASLSAVKSQTGVLPASAMVEELLTDNQIMIDVLNKAFDYATADNKQGLMNYLAERIETHNKHRWMLRASSK